jgi:dCTP diphosphatase
VALPSTRRKILSADVTEFENLREQLRHFAAARDWDQFHSPKNLAMALSVEAAELLEVFQWLTEAQSRGLSPEAHAAASDEIADVLLYLIRLSDALRVDPIAAAQRKLVANAEKYPVDKARGNSRKYTEL